MNSESKIPFAVRDPLKEKLFTERRTDFKNINPDCASPAVEGYFRFPAVWIGSAPSEHDVRILNPAVHHEIVYRRDLNCNLRVCVKRDGTFLFDFSKWPLAPLVVVPGYERLEGTYRQPPETTRLHQLAENYAVVRAQVMNVHQACINTAEQIVLGTHFHVGALFTAWNTHKAMSFASVAGYGDDPEDMYALARNVVNNKDNVRREVMPRRVVSLEVVDQSFTLLEKILVKEDLGLIQIIEAIYIAASRENEKRSGECVMLAWGACEQLISILWTSLLTEAKAAASDGEKVGGERLKKLRGRDYTASIMVEMLELAGKIPHDLYRELEIARKTRNKWAHEMRVPKASEAHLCVKAARSLLQVAKGIELTLMMGSRGGVPLWHIWGWHEVLANGGP